jgi:hypothetical protein
VRSENKIQTMTDIGITPDLISVLPAAGQAGSTTFTA